MKFVEFTLEQKETYTAIHDLEEKLMLSVQPDIFILNPETVRLRKEIEEYRSKCKHVWEDGYCAVCGKEESDK